MPDIDPLLHFTVFKDRFASSLIRRKKTWGALTGILEKPRIRNSKESCHLIKLATFGEVKTSKGSYRSNDNMLGIFGIEGDYDAGDVTPEQAAHILRLAGIKSFIYTSSSHTVEHPRWRVLAPLSQAYPVSDRYGFIGMLNAVLGGILAKESFTDSQAYYYGKVVNKPYETHNIDGYTIDVVSFALGDPLYPEENQPAKTPRDSNNSDVSKGKPDSPARTDVLQTADDNTIDDLKSALKGLAPLRADDRKLWIDIVQALASFKQTKYAETAHRLAHDFSARCKHKYDAKYLDEVWAGMKPDRITYRSIFDWAQKDGWINPRSLTGGDSDLGNYNGLEDRSDTGNANILERLAGGNLRYVPERGRWLWWDGLRWIADDFAIHVYDAALRVGEYYINKADELRKQLDNGLCQGESTQVKKAIESLMKWAVYTRNRRGLDAMLAIACKSASLQISANSLDSDPWLFGVENGVIDLRTGALRPAARDEFVTKRSSVCFNPEARAPRFEQFIAEITSLPGSNGTFVPRESMAKYLQRALGYSLTGVTAEQKMFVCIGAGANGKNVLLDIIQFIAGGYCQTIPPEALMATKHSSDSERPSPVVATLAGARVAISSESKDGQKLDVALVKRHTGGGFMTARFLRENPFRFEITHKLWLMTNHRPAMDHMDDAIRGRLHLIPFDCQWNRPGHTEKNLTLPEGDKNLPEKLKEEAEGILAWLVTGAFAYLHAGLEPPSAVIKMTNQYFQDYDYFGNWLDGHRKCDPKKGILAKQLFEHFEEFCASEGYSDWTPNNPTAFGIALKTKGINFRKDSDGVRYGLCPITGNHTRE